LRAGVALFVVAIVIPSIFFGSSAEAGSFTWNGGADSIWANKNNWTGSGTFPGSGDTAIFNATAGSVSNRTTLTIGTGQGINTILFDTANAAAYTLGISAGSGTFVFDNLGAVTMNSTVANNQLINANVTFGTATASSYTFTNNSTTNSLTFAGAIQGGTGGTAGAKTLTIGGAGAITINGTIANGGATSLALTKNGNGTLTLTASNSYTGTTTINGGTLVLGHATDTLSNTGFVDIVSGTLSLGNNSDTVGNVVLETGSLTGTGGTLTATNYDMRSGTVTANLAGNGTALFKSGSGGLSLTGTNTYTGGTTINGGDVTFNNSSALGTGTITFGANAFGIDSSSLMSTTTVSLSNNIVVINDTQANPNRTATLGSFSTSASGANAYTGNITLNNSLIIKSSLPTSNPLLFSGTISGTGGLSINPSGTLSPGAVQISGNNSYSGNTTVAAGTLLVTGGVTGTSSATGTGSVTVSGSGTFLAGGSTTGTTGNMSGAVSIGSGSHLSPGTSGDGTGNTAILHTGALTLSSGSIFNVNLNGTTAGSGYDQLIASSVTSINGSSLSLNIGGTLQVNDKFFIVENSSATSLAIGTFSQGATISSGGYTFAINYADNGDGGLVANDISLTVLTAVPEPGTWVGAGLALAALAFAGRRRAKR
jgi:autotransporter-associated beta strand protein